MASTSETGHARNVANFEALLTACTAFGASYQPSNPDLQIASLGSRLEQARFLMAKVKEDSSTWTRSVGERQAIFAPLKGLTTRIVGAVSSSGASAESLRKVQSIQRKIQGKRASSKTVSSTAAADPDAPVKKTISVSQQSFPLLTDHFHELLSFLATEPKYKPNEADLKMDALQDLLATFQKCCTTVKEQETNLQNARRERDTAMYAANTGCCAQALIVKAYVKSVFGASSAQYKQVSGLKFNNVTL